MSGDTTIQALSRLSHLPDSDNPAELIAAQRYYDVEFTGGSISNVTLTDVTINGINTALTQRVVTAPGDTTVLADDGVIIIDKIVPEITTVTFPASPTNNRYIVIKDGAGNAGAFNITLDGNGKLIDGQATQVIAVDYGTITQQFNTEEDQWNILYTFGDGGDVQGPGAATDNAITRFNGVSGQVLKNSGVIISDLNAVTGVTALTVDNIVIDGNTISSTSGNLNLTPVAGSAVVLDGTISVDAGVVTGATSIASTVFVGPLTGNASTATALQTARAINGVNFDGTAAITVTAAAGTLTGATLAAGVTASSLTSVGTIGTGVWQGTAIADTYIASAATWNAKQSAITFGTGVQTALGVNIGSAGAPVLLNGAGGTPSSITLTNASGTAASLNIGGSAPAGSLTGATLAAGVTGSSLTSVGTITSGTWDGTDIAVTAGGTGRSTSTTAYGLIAAGTTATGAHQTLAAGATTEILVGGGASALPVWTTASGTGSPLRSTNPTITVPNIVGVTNGSSATAGSVGEVVSSTIALGSATPLTTNTGKTITSITLSAGEWDITGMAQFTGNVATTCTLVTSCISLVANTYNSAGDKSASMPCSGTVFGGATAFVSTTLSTYRVNITGNTTYYLIGYATFLVNTCSGFGFLTATRIR